MAARGPRRSVLSHASPIEPLSRQQKLLALGLILAVMLVAFEVTAVITALPTITDELGGDSLYGLSLAAYLLATMVALVAAGELADRYGPALPFMINIAVFISGLILAAAAPTMVWVVVGRVLQGAGTGGFQPIAYVLVKRAFPTSRQPTMYAFLGAGWVLPSLFAPAISGWVTNSFGWRWVFVGVIPFALIVGALSVQPMRTYGPSVVDERRPASRVPLALAAAGGLGAIVTGLQISNPVAAVIIIAAGIGASLPALHRLMPHGVVRARTGLAAVVACRMLATAAFLGIDSFVPLAADRIHGVSPLVQGFVIVGAAVGWTGGQWRRARQPDLDPARAVRNGFIVMLIGIGLVSPVLSAHTPLVATFIAWAMGGIGMGLLFNPTTVSAMSHATDGAEGLVSSQVAMADSVGFALMGGVGGATVALADRTSFTLTGALGVNFAMAALLACVGIIASRGVGSAP